MNAREGVTRALVLGGGGVTGAAWELGVLVGLRDEGLDLRDANLVVGTSAGSVVGAQITTVADLDSLFSAQLIPAEQSSERSVDFDPAAMETKFRAVISAGSVNARAIRGGKLRGSGHLAACHHRGPSLYGWRHAFWNQR